MCCSPSNHASSQEPVLSVLKMGILALGHMLLLTTKETCEAALDAGRVMHDSYALNAAARAKRISSVDQIVCISLGTYCIVLHVLCC